MRIKIRNLHNQTRRIGGKHCGPGEVVEVDMDIEQAKAGDSAGYYEILEREKVVEPSPPSAPPPVKKKRAAKKASARKKKVSIRRHEPGGQALGRVLS